MKLNDDLKHIEIGRDKDVPIETNRSLWFLWINKEGDWDAERITRGGRIIEALEKPDIKNVFCCWHGQYKTNLFLMNKEDLIERLKKV